MDAQSLRESVTGAIRYWEPRRLAYNAVLALIVLIYFGLNYPTSRSTLSVDLVLSVFLLAVLANVAYCAAYPVDLDVNDALRVGSSTWSDANRNGSYGESFTLVGHRLSI
jgi:hypothetical protein